MSLIIESETDVKNPKLTVEKTSSASRFKDLRRRDLHLTSIHMRF